jgi:hypothetical protein
MASLTDFQVLSETASSVTFQWTYDITLADPQAQSYTLSLQVIGGTTIDVTNADLPYTLTGLRSGTAYQFNLILLYGGVSISQIVQNVRTQGSAPGPGPGPGAGPSPRTLDAFTISSVGWGAVRFTYALGGSDAYKLTFTGDWGGQPLNLTGRPSPVTVQGLPSGRTLTLTLTCASDGRATTLTRQVITPNPPPRPQPPAVLPQSANAVTLCLAESHFDTADEQTVTATVISLSNGNPSYLTQTSGRPWSAPIFLGGSFLFAAGSASQRQDISPGNYTVEPRIFGIALDIQHQTGNGPMQEITNRGVGFPVQPSLGGIWLSDPAVVSVSPGTLDVFAMGDNQGLYHRREANGVFAPAWEHLGGNFEGVPVAIGSASDTIELLAVHVGDLQLQHATFRPSANTMSSWTSTGVNVGSNIVACLRAPNVLDVLTLGANLEPYHASFQGGVWSSWTPLGGKSIFGRRPAICSWSRDRVDVCIVGTDNQYYHKWWDGSNWFPSASGWEPLGMNTVPDFGLNPSLLALSEGNLILFGGDPNAKVVSRGLTGGIWSKWVTHEVTAW